MPIFIFLRGRIQEISIDLVMHLAMRAIDSALIDGSWSLLSRNSNVNYLIFCLLQAVRKSHWEGLSKERRAKGFFWTTSVRFLRCLVPTYLFGRHGVPTSFLRKVALLTPAARNYYYVVTANKEAKRHCDHLSKLGTTPMACLWC